MRTLAACAGAVLRAGAPEAKVALTRRCAAEWRGGGLELGAGEEPPDHPSRPERPVLKALPASNSPVPLAMMRMAQSAWEVPVIMFLMKSR